MDEDIYNWIHNAGITASDAHKDGYQSYMEGLQIGDNPFNNNEEWDLYLAWNEGWSQAAWDD